MWKSELKKSKHTDICGHVNKSAKHIRQSDDIYIVFV